jgi:hypothetical protein
MTIFLLALLAVTPCKQCTKYKAEIKKLNVQISAMSVPVPYKVKSFEDARVKIRYYPDGQFDYEIKPQRTDVMVMKIKKKLAVQVLQNGEEIKSNVIYKEVK